MLVIAWNGFARWLLNQEHEENSVINTRMELHDAWNDYKTEQQPGGGPGDEGPVDDIPGDDRPGGGAPEGPGAPDDSTAPGGVPPDDPTAPGGGPGAGSQPSMGPSAHDYHSAYGDPTERLGGPNDD